MKSKLFTPFVTFLKQEIPAVLHILIFFEIIGLVLPNNFAKFFLTVAATLLVYWYLEEKGKMFLIKQIDDRFSQLNLEHLTDQDLAQNWKNGTVFVTLLIGVALAGITYNLALR